MISDKLVTWYLRDINKLKEEISLFTKEENLWQTKGDVKNCAGNLALHLIGNLKFFIGTQLGNTGYVRKRDNEFNDKNVPKTTLLKEIDEVIIIVEKVLLTISDEKFDTEYPVEFLGSKRTIGEILFIFYGHFNYHLGQINYLRRVLS